MPNSQAELRRVAVDILIFSGSIQRQAKALGCAEIWHNGGALCHFQTIFSPDWILMPWLGIILLFEAISQEYFSTFIMVSGVYKKPNY